MLPGGKEVSATYSKSVCVCSVSRPACRAYALNYIVSCGPYHTLPHCAILYQAVPYTERFSVKEKEIVNEHKMCVFGFSTVLSETFLILQGKRRVVTVHVQIPVCMCSTIIAVRVQ